MTIYPENENAGLSAELWTVQRVLSWSTGWLKEKAADATVNSRLEAELLLASVLDIDRMRLYLQLDRPLTKVEREAYKGQIRRRAEGEPIAYITGYRDFYRHRFSVSPAVLIPRPDTEILVEAALNAVASGSAPRILDVGTGSGCIAISLASELPEAVVDAWDIADEALAVASANVSSIGVLNVNLRVCDALSEVLTPGSYDLIVSNPPYIPRFETHLMSAETLNKEPALALFAPDDDGLTFYRRFASDFMPALREGGKIFLEIGHSQGAIVAQLFSDAGWRKITVVKDLAGHDRVVSAERA